MLKVKVKHVYYEWKGTPIEGLPIGALVHRFVIFLFLMENVVV